MQYQAPPPQQQQQQYPPQHQGPPPPQYGHQAPPQYGYQPQAPQQGQQPYYQQSPYQQGPPQQGSYSNQVRSGNAASCISHGSLAAAPSLYYSGSLLRTRLQIAEPMHIPCRYTSPSRQQGDLLLRDLGLVERQHPRWKGKWSFALCSVLC